MGTATRVPVVESPVTAEEFVAGCAGRRAELVAGRVVELPMPSPRHGKVCYRAAKYVGDFVDGRDLGHVMTNDSFVATGRTPDSVRGPDVSFYSYARLPKGEVPEGLLAAVPDLAVEVRSPSNAAADLADKAAEYHAAGVVAVVVLDSETATATVYRKDVFPQTFDNGDELTLPDVLPGFAVPVRQFFE